MVYNNKWQKYKMVMLIIGFIGVLVMFGSLFYQTAKGTNSLLIPMIGIGIMAVGFILMGVFIGLDQRLNRDYLKEREDSAKWQEYKRLKDKFDKEK